MTHLDNLVADSLAQSPDTVVHQLASEIERLRAAIGDALRPLYEGGHIYAKPLEDAIRKPAENLFHKNCRTCICWNGDMCKLISHVCENGEHWRPSTKFVMVHPEVAALADFAEEMRASASRFSDALVAVRADLAARDAEIADLKRGGVVVPELTEDCPRVEQTILHVPGVSRGNCFAATVAGLLKLPIDAIPQFKTEGDISWQEQFNGWLRQFGLAWLPLAGDDLAGECQQLGITGLWSEMSGKSPRFDVGHSCVAKDGRLAWDPHPEQTGLERPIWWHGVFIALRPWDLASRLRTIPADRELMRLVDELIRWHGLRPLDKRPDHAAALVGAIKALRAQPTQELAP